MHDAMEHLKIANSYKENGNEIAFHVFMECWKIRENKKINFDNIVKLFSDLAIPPNLISLYSSMAKQTLPQDGGDSLTMIASTSDHWRELISALLMQATTFHRSGATTEAERGYLGVLLLAHSLPGHDATSYVDNPLHLLGVIESHRSHFPAAIRLLKAATHLNPDLPGLSENVRTLKSRALSWIYTLHRNEAFREATQITFACYKADMTSEFWRDLLMRHINTLVQRTVILRRSGDLEAAQAHAADALAISPHHSGALREMGRILYKTGKMREGLEMMTFSLAQEFDPDLLAEVTSASVESINAISSLQKQIMGLKQDPVAGHDISDLFPAGLTVNIIDIGAQSSVYGDHDYSVLMKHIPCRIIGFEAQADKAEERARRESNLTIYPFAVGRGGPATFYETSFSEASSIYEPNIPLLSRFTNVSDLFSMVKTSKIETFRIDDIIPEVEADLMTLDVQGAELDVLEGGKKVLSQASLIILEVSFIEMYKNQPLFADVERFMKENEFNLIDILSIHRYSHSNLIKSSRFNSVSAWGGAIYINKIENILNKGTDAIWKCVASLHYCFQKYDFCAYLLEELDQRTGRQDSRRYADRINSTMEAVRPVRAS